MSLLYSGAFRPLIVDCLFEGSSLPSNFMELLNAKAKERAASVKLTIVMQLHIIAHWERPRNRWAVRAIFEVIEGPS
jgi:hypothetical protein